MEITEEETEKKKVRTVGDTHIYIYSLPGGTSGQDSACHAGDARNAALILGLGRCPGGGYATHLRILAWRIPWTEEPGRLWSIGSTRSQRVTHD